MPSAENDRRIEILSERDLRKTLVRLATQVLEGVDDSGRLMLLGIPTRGVQLSRVLALELERLTGHANSDIRAAAERVFAGQASESRETVLKRFLPALSLKGDARRGQEVHQKSCMQCHQVNGIGTHIGPNLAFMKSRTSQEALIHILDPNREVSPEYVLHTAVRKDGQEISGLPSAESDDSVTIRQAVGKAVIPRSDLISLKSASLSMMPEGLEQGFTLQAMADLLAFLQSHRYDIGTEKDGRSPEAPEEER